LSPSAHNYADLTRPHGFSWRHDNNSCVLGKIIADIVFYAIAIFGYELGKALPH